MLEKSICELELTEQIQICKDSTDHVKVYTYIMSSEQMGSVKTYKLLDPHSIFSKRKEEIISACKCPIRPAIYLKNRSATKKVKIVAERGM